MTSFSSLQQLGLLLLCFLVTSPFALSQTAPTLTDQAPKVVPPSPNAAALGKYGDIPVSTYTGLPNISIPLYQIESRDISVPISLSYHASGIKVAEEASRVGLGWVLNAGGAITRTVMGRDDFDSSVYGFFNSDTPELPMGFTNRPRMNIQPSCEIHFEPDNFTLPTSYTQDTDQGYDFQPDQYNYNFLGYSGKFILDRSKQAFLQQPDKILIKPDSNGNSWEIKTANGFTYSFTDFEFYQDPEGGAQSKSAWYLSQIKSLSGETVTFHYQTVPTPDFIRSIGAYSERFYEANLAMPPPLSGCSVSPPPPTQQGVVPGKYYSNIYLDYIDFRNGRVVFTYEDRLDVEGDKKIKAVKIFRKQAGGTLETTPFKEFELGYDYFIGDATSPAYLVDVSRTELITHRLKLVSLTEKGTASGVTTFKSPYLFSYYEPSQRPKKTSFARDHWGYYNQNTANTSLVPQYTQYPGGVTNDDRINGYIGIMKDQNQRNTNPDPGVVSVFSLKQIQYPTGGRTEFQYEPHEYDVQNSRERDNSYFGQRQPFIQDNEKSLMYGDTTRGVWIEVGELDLRNLYVRTDGTLTPTTLSARFRYSVPPSGSNDIVNNTDGVQFELQGVGGTTVAASSATLFTNSGVIIYTYTNSYYIPPGLYKWMVFIKTPQNDANNKYFQDVAATYKFQERIDPSVTPIIGYAGGLRLKRLIHYNEEGETSRKRYEYRYKVTINGVETEKSYGRLMAMPQYTYLENRKNNTPSGECGLSLLVVRSSDSNIPLNGSAGGSVVGYDQVIELHGENGENGKTVYQYENQSDEVLNYDVAANLTPSEDGRPATLVRVPSRPPAISTIPDPKNGLLLKQIDYAAGDTTPIKETENSWSVLPIHVDQAVFYGFEKRMEIVTGGTPAPCSPLIYFYPALQSHWKRLIWTEDRVYDQQNRALVTVNRTSYTYESTPQHFQPTSVTRSGTGLTTEYSYPLDYAGVSSGVIAQLKSDEVFLHNAPIETVTRRVGGGVIGATFTTYADVDGNSLDASVKMLPVKTEALEVVTPKTNFTSSLALGTAADANYRPQQEITYYPATGNIAQVTRTDGIAITYLWGYNHTYPIAEIKNATLQEVQTALGQTAMDDLAASPSLSTAQINQLNSLRGQSSLLKAMITTFTYDPLKGVLTQTDPNGVTVSYEYDPLGRLQFVRDRDQHLLKEYRYHYKQ